MSGKNDAMVRQLRMLWCQLRMMLWSVNFDGMVA